MTTIGQSLANGVWARTAECTRGRLGSKNHTKLLHRRRDFLGCRHLFLANDLKECGGTSVASQVATGTRASGFDLSKLMGGRGMIGGEETLKTNEGRARLFKDEARTKEKPKKERLQDLEGEIGTFDKEMLGLTGGFPGGETGLKSFVATHPPPLKLSKELEALRDVLAIRDRSPRTSPPLLMPGMTVRVVSPNDPYYQYTGIVQRVTDGRVGVLFEGGNWDKLITFSLADLLRTEKGPPMKNPKSAILELGRDGLPK